MEASLLALAKSIYYSGKEICVWKIFSSQRLVNDKLVSVYIFNNYSPKAKLILLNN